MRPHERAPRKSLLHASLHRPLFRLMVTPRCNSKLLPWPRKTQVVGHLLQEASWGPPPSLNQDSPWRSWWFVLFPGQNPTSQPLLVATPERGHSGEPAAPTLGTHDCVGPRPPLGVQSCGRRTGEITHCTSVAGWEGPARPRPHLSSRVHSPRRDVCVDVSGPGAHAGVQSSAQTVTEVPPRTSARQGGCL